MKHRARHSTFSDQEVEALVQAAPTAWWDAFIRLSVASGLRVQEILRLYDSDIDPSTISVRVTEVLIDYEHEDHPLDLRRPLPVHRERVVPVDENTMYALVHLLDECPPDTHVFVPSWKLNQLWFRLHDGDPLSTDHLCPSLDAGFRMVQRRAMLNLARDRQITLAQVQWPMRPVSALRLTAIQRLSSELTPRKLAEHLGLASTASILAFYDHQITTQPEGAP
jgi:integrase